MKNKSLFISITLVGLLFLSGCSNQGSDLTQENAQLKSQVANLQQKLTEVNDKLQQQEELYDLRNNLDNNFHYALRALIKGDYQTVQQYLTDNVQINDKKLIIGTGTDAYEFIIPDKAMDLRQRAYSRNGDQYSTIYEIYDAGYTSGTKYDDRTYTLNVGYILVNGQWKINSIKIDE